MVLLLKFPIFSQTVTTTLVDQVVEGHAEDVLAMKERVEDMWRTSDSKRVRRTKATQEAPGSSLYADNVGMKTFNLKKNINDIIGSLCILYKGNRKSYFLGKVVNTRHNTGLDHKGHYLTMAQVLAIENRVPSAHLR